MLPALPRVTIGIPLYKGEKHISQAIATVRADEFSDWEILVLDDCSPDSSAKIVTQISDRRIRLISSPINAGLVNARNRILDEARGEFLAWLDQDDLNYPNRLAKQVAFLDAHPEVSLIASWTDVHVQLPDRPLQTYTQVRPDTHAGIRAAMPFTNPIACNTVMMRRKHFQDGGFSFREEFGNTLDYDLWSRASDTLTFHALREPLGAYRVHSQQTSQGSELERMNQHALQIQSDFLERNLDLFMSPEERKLHADITRIPIRLREKNGLASVKAWFGRLRAASIASEKFDHNAFDFVLAQQWFRVVDASQELSAAEKIFHGTRGAHDMGVPWNRVVAALRSAVIQRQVQR